MAPWLLAFPVLVALPAAAQTQTAPANPSSTVMAVLPVDVKVDGQEAAAHVAHGVLD